MAIIASLAGGMLGFFAALTGMIGFGLGPLAALGLWTSTGLTFTVLGLAWALLSGRPDVEACAPAESRA